jgi:hypothetical protein
MTTTILVVADNTQFRHWTQPEIAGRQHSHPRRQAVIVVLISRGRLHRRPIIEHRHHNAGTATTAEHNRSDGSGIYNHKIQQHQLHQPDHRHTLLHSTTPGRVIVVFTVGNINLADSFALRQIYDVISALRLDTWHECAGAPCTPKT